MKKLMTAILSAILLLGTASPGFCEEALERDRRDEIQNRELRRAVAADREAAKQAHEKEMAKQRETDAQRLETIDGSKGRYRDVIEERKENEQRSPDEKEKHQQKLRAEKLQKNEKQKTK